MSLDEHLGAVYRERVIIGAGDAAAAAFAAALATDAELAEAARAELDRLRQIPESKCFISAQRKRYLEAALALH